MIIENTHQYIKNTWKKAVVSPEDMEEGFRLPYPCVPPCVTGMFRCLFYWDTFYTNLGLLSDGEIELAKNNVDNLIYLLNKYCFVPNANSVSGTKWCSQPPYLHWMVQVLDTYIHDEVWLKNAYRVSILDERTHDRAGAESALSPSVGKIRPDRIL